MLFYKRYSRIGYSKTGILNDRDFSETTTDFKLVKICVLESLPPPPSNHKSPKGTLK